jgi:tetratricopeptide (TPR) repeat protein
MQNALIKLPFLFVLVIFSASGVPAGQLNDELRHADSLFAEKKFTQSLERYEHLLSQGYESPAMLLRMAYIEEGLQQYARALYYLNRYYRLHPDKMVWQKIAALAAQQKLSGYDMSLFWHGVSVYRVKRVQAVLINLAVVAVIAVMLWLYRKPVVKRSLIVLQIFAVGLLLLQLNMRLPQFAIVAENGVPVMSGPSAGADVVGRVDSGNRLKVLGRADVWVKVADRNLTGYIRSANLLLL